MVQIGFEQTSYVVEEWSKSVTVCASVIAGTPTVSLPVTLATVDIASAQGEYDDSLRYSTVQWVISQLCTEEVK